MLVLAAALAAPALGQQASDREQELIRRLRQQVQQLQAQQSEQQQQLAQAQGEKAALQKQLEQARAELARVRGSGAAQAQRLSQVEQAEAALGAERDQLQARVRDLEQAAEAASRDLAAAREEGQRGQRSLAERDAALLALQQRLGANTQALQVCAVRNDALHTLGLELLDRYAQVGLGDVLSRREPFLQLKRVELQNQVTGYREQLEQQSLRVTPAGPGETGSGAPGAR